MSCQTRNSIFFFPPQEVKFKRRGLFIVLLFEKIVLASLVCRRYMKLQSLWSPVPSAGDWLHFLYSKKKKKCFVHFFFFLFEGRKGELTLSWSLFSLSLVDICFIHTWFLILLLCTVVWFWVPLWVRPLAGDEWRSALCFTSSSVFHSAISGFVVFLSSSRR